MKILTRDEFTTLMQLRFAEKLNSHHPIWNPEDPQRNPPAQWFVCVTPLKLVSADKEQFWNWCNTQLKSSVACYYSDSDNKEEYWGFSGELPEILIWLLKWAH